jgi:nucleotide-binding universal stress UspA family protein
MLGLRTILHPTDFSDRSQCAYALACALARESGARLLVVHVVQPPPFITQGDIAKALRRAEDYRRDLADRLRRLQCESGDIEMEFKLEDGEPSAEILRMAEEYDCDLIVMGTHGRTGFRRLLMGSVAEEVVRRAACPVLTVNPPLNEQSLFAAGRNSASILAGVGR